METILRGITSVAPMFQEDPTCPSKSWRGRMAAKYASLTPYNYSFNNPVAFSDPSGADPNPDYQNPNHQYYFHNGAGSAGYPGLTYDDVVPQAARGEFNSAFGWRQDTMLGWFNGSGPSLNAGSFGSQTIRYMTGLAREMANLTMAALNRGDGVTLMNFSGGHLTSSDYKSTAVFFREVGRELAREYYGGEGRMAEGYMPASYMLFPAVGQVVGLLPSQTGSGLFDERGSELFNRWLSGEGGSVYMQDGVWGDYMRANGLLSTQIHNALSKDALSRTGTGPVNIRMNAVIQNGYSTGYEMLHGTNAGVGGFEINGFATLSEGTFTYQVQMIWHDIIDPNPQYFMDIVYSRILSVLGPKDYEVHISWSDTFYKIKD